MNLLLLAPFILLTFLLWTVVSVHWHKVEPLSMITSPQWPPLHNYGHFFGGHFIHWLMNLLLQPPFHLSNKATALQCPLSSVPQAETPTSRDLKSGDSLFFTNPPPGISTDPPPPSMTNWPSPQWEWLKTIQLWSLTWSTYYQNLQSSFWWQN